MLLSPKVFSKILWILLAVFSLFCLVFFLKPEQAAPDFSLKYKGALLQKGALVESSAGGDLLSYGGDALKLGKSSKLQVLDSQKNYARLTLVQGSVERVSFSGMYRFEFSQDTWTSPDLILGSVLKKEGSALASFDGPAFFLDSKGKWYLGEAQEPSLPKEAALAKAPDSLAYLKGKTSHVDAWWHRFSWTPLSKQELLYAKTLNAWYEILYRKNFSYLPASSLTPEDAQWIRWWISGEKSGSFQRELLRNKVFSTLFSNESHQWLYMENLRRSQALSESSLNLFLTQLEFLEKAEASVSESFLKSFLSELSAYPVLYWNEEALAQWESLLESWRKREELSPLFFAVQKDILDSFQSLLLEESDEEIKTQYEVQLGLLKLLASEEDDWSRYEDFVKVLESQEFYLTRDFEKAYEKWSQKKLLLENLNLYLQKWKSGELPPLKTPSKTGMSEDSILSRLNNAAFESVSLTPLKDPSSRLYEVLIRTKKGDLSLRLDKQTALIYEIRSSQKRYNEGLFLQDFSAWWSKIGQDYL